MDIGPFLEYLRTEDRTQQTIEGYRVNLGLFIRWFEENTGQKMTAARATPLDLIEYRRHLLASKYKAGTINQKLSYLRGFFDWAVAQGLAPSNPASKIKLVQQMPHPPKWLERPQVYALLRAAQESVQLAELRHRENKKIVTVRTWAMVALMLHAGLRVSEVLDLQRGDVVIGQRSGSVTVRRGKGRKHRTVPLNADARRALSAWLGMWPGPAWLFAGLANHKRPLHVRTVQYHLARLGKAAGIPGLTPHQLRHTFGKTLVDMGVSIDRVARLMGHSSVDTTALYTMPSEADLQRAVDLIAWSD